MDLQTIAHEVARLFSKHELSYDQTKRVVALARRRLGLHPTKKRGGSAKRLSQEETERFIAEAYRQSGRTGLMLRTLLETGLRVSEFVGLDAGDVSFEEQLVTVRRGKGDKRREVPITVSLSRELRLHLGDRRTGPLFRSRSGGAYSARRIQQIVAATAEAALIEGRVYPHLLRHTMATRLVNQGMPISSVQKLLGHEDIKTTQVYAVTETATMQRDFERAMDGSST